MCVEPTTALAIASVASAGIQYQTGKQQQKAQYQAQIRQNELAKQNAIRRYASEQLRIRQVVAQNMQKGYEASKKAQATRASFIAKAGDEGGLALSGSTQALLRDYFRTEGNYKNSLTNNLNINISQFERNMEAIQFGQESQSTYVQPPNPELLFATQALNVANTYYSLEYMKELKGLQSNKTKQKNLSQLDELNV
jgi:hypothetical protein